MSDTLTGTDSPTLPSINVCCTTRGIWVVLLYTFNPRGRGACQSMNMFRKLCWVQKRRG